MRCEYCGYLDWTIAKYGRLIHKRFCLNRGTDPVFQGQPTVTDVKTVIDLENPPIPNPLVQNSIL